MSRINGKKTHTHTQHSVKTYRYHLCPLSSLAPRTTSDSLSAQPLDPSVRPLSCALPLPLPAWQSNEEEFCKKLAELCDYYVNDAFGTAHRAHASTEGITKFVERKVRDKIFINS